MIITITTDKSSLRTSACYHLFALLLAFSASVSADTVLQNNAIVHYNKVASDRLGLDIRPLDTTPISKVSAQLEGIDLPVSTAGNYPSKQQTTAILFLVDTSDPGRQQAMENNIRHIDQLLGFQRPHYRYGLAHFDTDLHFLTQLGVSPDTIRQKAHGLKAEGKTTELYRNTLGAIKQLSRYPADRRFLFLLSDGRAEDRAYFHRDVTQAAIKNNISVFTIGYADTVSLTVALQTLRRLSEETGGQYLSTQPGTYQLDNSQLQQMFDSIDLGALFNIDLTPALQANIGGRQEITLSITSGSSHTLVSLPVKLPAIRQAQATPIIPVTPVAAEPAVQQIIIERIPAETSAVLTEDIYWLLIALSVLMVSSILFLAVKLRNRTPTAAPVTPTPAESTDDAYAWLEMADDTSAHPRRYPIHSTETKIGRYRGNDIALHDSAISRYHAEIHITDDGRFVIADMGSTNGLSVNDKEVLEQRLENNDIVEIGDVRLRFVIPEELADDLEDTQMFRTQVPVPGSSEQN